MKKLKVGKLDSDVLDRIVLSGIKFKRPEVRTGAEVGEDCAVIDFGEYDCVVSTDPITASVQDVGKLSIHISCNDIASNGVQPVGITLAVMLPEGSTEEDLMTIMTQAAQAAEVAQVQIAGGHTEVTPAVRQPVIVSTAFGRVLSGKSANAKNMRENDLILLTKNAGLEGTGIIASDREDELGGILSAGEIAQAKSMLNDVSVVKEGVIAGEIGTAGMHDVTEGGVYGAVWEMCRLASMGAEIYEEKIFVHPVTRKIAKHFGIDPMRLISSGCMLIVANSGQADAIIAECKKEEIEISVIGRVRAKECGVKALTEKGDLLEIEPPEADELYKVI